MARQQLRRWAAPALPAGLFLLMLGGVWAEQLSRYHGGVEWYLGRVDGSTLTVAMRGGDCDRLDHVEVDETPTRVTVAVIDEFPAPPGDFVCTQQLHVRCARIELDTPLGARRLVHAPVDAVPEVVDPYPLIALPAEVGGLYGVNC